VLKVILYILVYSAIIYMLICLIFFLIQERLIFIPTKQGTDYEFRLATPYEEHFIDTPNGGKINALLLTVEKSKGVIYYLHGNTGSIKRWRFMAEELTSYGYDVFVIDYRGYGKSKGHRTEELMHSDVEVCFSYLKSRYVEKPIVVYGRSLGSGFGIRLCSKVQADRLILETPYYSLLHVARFYFPFLPTYYLMRFRFRSDLFIDKVKCPIAIFHGTKDRIVPYHSALALFKEVEENSGVEMTTLVGARHNNLNAYPLFRERMSAFLDVEQLKENSTNRGLPSTK